MVSIEPHLLQRYFPTIASSVPGFFSAVHKAKSRIMSIRQIALDWHRFLLKYIPGVFSILMYLGRGFTLKLIRHKAEHIIRNFTTAQHLNDKRQTFGHPYLCKVLKPEGLSTLEEAVRRHAGPGGLTVNLTGEVKLASQQAYGRSRAGEDDVLAACTATPE